MYKKVLVPLDGSAIAECTLSNVKNLAKEGSIGEVILLNVAEIHIPLSSLPSEDDTRVPSFDFPAFRKAILDKSRNYLARMESKLKAEGIKVESVVIEGYQSAQDITNFSKQNGVDLIVIATHGYTGMKKMLLGSVAFKVLHESHVPVLLIRPESCQI